MSERERPLGTVPLRRAADAPAPSGRAAALDLARDAVVERAGAYGAPSAFFENVALRWSLTLGQPISARDVARCLIDVKVERAALDRDGDSAVDIAGYAAILYELDAPR